MYDQIPAAFFALRKSGIKSVKDFPGRVFIADRLQPAHLAAPRQGGEHRPELGEMGDRVAGAAPRC